MKKNHFFLTSNHIDAYLKHALDSPTLIIH